MSNDLDIIKWYSAMGVGDVIHLNEPHAHGSIMQTCNLDAIIDESYNKARLKTPKSVVTTISRLVPQLQKEFVDDVFAAQSRGLADSAVDLDALREAVYSFDACALKHSAQNTVFADGNPSSKIMVIGEAPGATEDKMGIPFCGDSGKLLDEILGSIGLTRENNCYITNTVFWRPPANRQPTSDEISICRPFVEKHIALISPEILLLVGATAVSALLGDHLQISRIRQEQYLYNNRYLTKPVLTTAIFHPAYLLRQPMQKQATWYDMLKIKGMLGT